MNDLQKAEFDLFKCFVDVCEKLHLNYFMLEGSALGAARHSGFIPWDDDLDVGMYREDYNKFLEQAQALLPEGLFLQNYKTDPEFPLLYTKLRNSNTTYIEKLHKKYNINHGIYIDIFVLDGYPTSRMKQILLDKRKIDYIIKYNCGEKMKRTFKGVIYAWLLRRLGYHKRQLKTMGKRDAYISKYPIQGSSIVCNHGSPYGKKDYIPAVYYGDGADAMFEGMKVKVPANADGYLTSLYGDWRTPPAPDKRGYRHPYEICDIERPYTYYINKEEGQ